MCDCINEMNEAIEAAGHNTQIEPLRILRHDKQGHMLILERVDVRTGKLDSKNRKKPTSITPTFCPFCGRKYPDTAEVEADRELTAKYPRRDKGVYLRLCGTCGGDWGAQPATDSQSAINSMLGNDEKSERILIRYAETMPNDLPECHCGRDENEDEQDETEPTQEASDARSQTAGN